MVLILVCGRDWWCESSLGEVRHYCNLGVTAVGKLLAKLGLTPQKPLKRAYERGPAKELPPRLGRTLVNYRTKELSGRSSRYGNTYLYLVLGNGKALRYGIGVGREGSPGQGSKKYREWKPGPTGARRKKRDD